MLFRSETIDRYRRGELTEMSLNNNGSERHLRCLLTFDKVYTAQDLFGVLFETVRYKKVSCRISLGRLSREERRLRHGIVTPSPQRVVGR